MVPTRCTRHHKNVWMAYCADCTAWHLHRQIARRNGALGTGLSTPSAACASPR